MMTDDDDNDNDNDNDNNNNNNDDNNNYHSMLRKGEFFCSIPLSKIRLNVRWVCLNVVSLILTE